MSLEASARKSSWLSKLIRVPVSPSTCLRFVNKCIVPAQEKIRHIGIDDWAYHKGHTYGTILVDRETGKAIDLIKSREKEDIVRWLKVHPTIETVTRDRAECYSQSISLVLPKAVQITDRFHLVMNYSDYVAKIAQKLLPDLKRIKLKRTVPAGNEKEIQRIIKLAQGGPDLLRAHKTELILKAKKLYQKGHSKNKIAEILNLNFRTAQKYIDHTLDQIGTGRRPRVDYSNYLEDLILGYCTGEKLSLVFRKIKKKGFKGTRRGLSARFGAIYKEGKQYNKATFQNTKRQYLPQAISVRKLSIYLTNKNYKKILSPDEIDVFQKVKIKNPLIRELWDLSEGFRNMFERKSIALFGEWINQVMRSSFNSLKGFVRGLIKDLEAVKAAVAYKDSNGLTEGNVNRLKNIKRQMYGRAGFELLRRKVILSNTG
jgi:transposase